MRRGEVWWANLPPPSGPRPVVLLSRNAAYSVREYVTIAPISRRIRGIQTEVPLGPNDGLPHPCAANVDTINTIPKHLLQSLITNLSHEKLEAVEEAIHFALALEK